MPKVDIPFETLVIDLHGVDWTKRCDAARLLGQSKDPRAVDVLLPDLKDSNWKVRRNAAQALGTLKSTRAVDGLVEALKDRTATVRQRAAVALGRTKNPDTIPALVEAVIEEKDGIHINVNEGAYQAVRKFGKKAGPALMQALQAKQNVYLVKLLADSKYDVGADFFISLAGSHDPTMRRVALTALGNFNQPQVIDFLLGTLTKADPETQILAVEALRKLKAVETAPRLLDLLQGDQLYGPQAGLYRAVCDAFQEFSGNKKDLAQAFSVDSKPVFNIGGGRTTLAGMMGMLGNEGFQKLNQTLAGMESAVDELNEKLNLPPGSAQTFSDMTWKFGAMYADARDAKGEQVKRLIELLNADSALTRAAAALNLPWYMDSGALEPLEHAIQDENEMVKQASTWAYAVLKKRSP